MGTHRTLDDIATNCNIKRKELSRDFRILHSRLNIKIPQQDPMKCIAKVANKVKLSEKTKRDAVTIMSNVMREELSAEKDPMGLAACVLYMSVLNLERLLLKQVLHRQPELPKLLSETDSRI